LGLIPTIERKKEKKKVKVKCMLTGEYGNNDQVICAHIIPCATTNLILASLQLSLADTNNPRNVLFLSKGVEKAFDKLQISFIPVDILNPSSFKMKIWDDACRILPIWEGSTRLISDFDGSVLNMMGHNPFRRCLSYQAYQAYINQPKSADWPLDPPAYFGTPERPSLGVTCVDNFRAVMTDLQRGLD